MTLTELERDRIIKDIVNHTIEERTVGEGEEMSISDVEELERKLKQTPDDKLEVWWIGNVGEWVASRDLDPDEQFAKLRETGDAEYGYVAYKYNTPYA